MDMKIAIILLGLVVFYPPQVLSQPNWLKDMKKTSEDLLKDVKKATADLLKAVQNIQINRPKDETGHKTGLGTLAKSALNFPKETYQAVNAFLKSYDHMRKANIKGGNLEAHERANYEATKLMKDPKVASAISAFREWSKGIRTPASHTKAARKGWGDTRTPKEIKDTMNANKEGRERAMKELNRKLKQQQLSQKLKQQQLNRALKQQQLNRALKQQQLNRALKQQQLNRALKQQQLNRALKQQQLNRALKQRLGNRGINQRNRGMNRGNRGLNRSNRGGNRVNREGNRGNRGGNRSNRGGNRGNRGGNRGNQGGNRGNRGGNNRG